MTEHSAPRAPAEDFRSAREPFDVGMGGIGSIERSPDARTGRFDRRRRRVRIASTGTRRFSRIRSLFRLRPDAKDVSYSSDLLWFMTGHQPELYHPGVWAKNLAVAAIARPTAAWRNLVADTDQMKSNSVRVISGSMEAPRIVQVPFDEVEDGRPFEAWKVHDERIFRGFADSVRSADVALPPDPLLDTFWPKACSIDSDSARDGSRSPAARSRSRGASAWSNRPWGSGRNPKAWDGFFLRFSKNCRDFTPFITKSFRLIAGTEDSQPQSPCRGF